MIRDPGASEPTEAGPSLDLVGSEPEKATGARDAIRAMLGEPETIAELQTFLRDAIGARKSTRLQCPKCRHRFNRLEPDLSSRLKAVSLAIEQTSGRPPTQAAPAVEEHDLDERVEQRALQLHEEWLAKCDRTYVEAVAGFDEEALALLRHPDRHIMARASEEDLAQLKERYWERIKREFTDPELKKQRKAEWQQKQAAQQDSP
jgi:hypothetical protein